DERVDAGVEPALAPLAPRLGEGDVCVVAVEGAAEAALPKRHALDHARDDAVGAAGVAGGGRGDRHLVRLGALERPLALEHRHGGTGLLDRAATVLGAPLDLEVAPAQAHGDLPAGAARQHACDPDGRGARAARPGLARAALPGPLDDLAARDDLDELDVRPPRERRMGLEERPV